MLTEVSLVLDQILQRETGDGLQTRSDVSADSKGGCAGRRAIEDETQRRLMVRMSVPWLAW